MGIARTVVVLHDEPCSLVGSVGHFCAFSIGGDHLHRIVAGRQTYHVGTSVGAIVAHQLGINLGVVGKLSALHIDIIRGSPFEELELHVGRLQPTLGLADFHLACRIGVSPLVALFHRNTLGEADVGHLVGKGIAVVALVDLHVRAVNVDAGKVGSIVIALGLVVQGQHSLALDGALCHREVVAGRLFGLRVLARSCHLDAIDVHAAR